MMNPYDLTEAEEAEIEAREIAAAEALAEERLNRKRKARSGGRLPPKPAVNPRLLYTVPCRSGRTHSPATVENFRATQERDRLQARVYRAKARGWPKGSEQRQRFASLARTCHVLAARWNDSLPPLP